MTGQDDDATATAELSRVTEEAGSAILCSMDDEARRDEAEEERWLSIPQHLIEGAQGGRLTQKQARLWALVLESRFIESRIEHGERGWRLRVPASSFDAACKELRSYVEENRNWPPFLPPVRPMVENTIPTLCVLLLLATFHNLTTLDINLMGQYPVQWAEIGQARASDILGGEWWRLLTALTLHADALHLLSNLAIGGIFVIYLCRDLGSGLAWTLILLAGAFGNLANAYVQLPSHASIGSSTAVFGAVGILGAVTMTRYRHHLRRRWPLPVAAALSLLALLGTEGEKTDLGAHLFGFCFGSLFGLVAELLVGYFGRPGRLVNALLAVTGASVLVCAWWLALRHAG